MIVQMYISPRHKPSKDLLSTEGNMDSLAIVEVIPTKHKELTSNLLFCGLNIGGLKPDLLSIQMKNR